jgi:hypothetical protein
VDLRDAAVHCKQPIGPGRSEDSQTTRARPSGLLILFCSAPACGSCLDVALSRGGGRGSGMVDAVDGPPAARRFVIEAKECQKCSAFASGIEWLECLAGSVRKMALSGGKSDGLQCHYAQCPPSICPDDLLTVCSRRHGS